MLLCLEESVENSLVNIDFADYDFVENYRAGLDQAELDHSDFQDENEQAETVQADLLDQIGIDRVNAELHSAWRDVNATTFTNPIETLLNVQRDDRC